MRKDLGKEAPVDRSEINNAVILRFMSLCLACGNAFTSTPTSPAIAMYTMFRKSINNITAGIGYSVTSTREESVACTSMIAVRCRVKLEVLCKAIKSISSEMVITPTHGMSYIRNLRPIAKLTLTNHGMELMMANKVKATYDIERLKEVYTLKQHQHHELEPNSETVDLSRMSEIANITYVMVKIPEFVDTLLSMLSAVEASIIIEMFGMEHTRRMRTEFMNPIRDLGPVYEYAYRAMKDGHILMLAGEHVHDMFSRITYPMEYFKKHKEVKPIPVTAIMISWEEYRKQTAFIKTNDDLNTMNAMIPILQEPMTWYTGPMEVVPMPAENSQNTTATATIVNRVIGEGDMNTYNAFVSGPSNDSKCGLVKGTWCDVMVISKCVSPNGIVRLESSPTFAMGMGLVDECMLNSTPIWEVPRILITQLASSIPFFTFDLDEFSKYGVVATKEVVPRPTRRMYRRTDIEKDTITLQISTRVAPVANYQSINETYIIYRAHIEK
ncbi:hypothetical protein F5Y03DRAFT_400885 [Xylaria venustula]|nr:hypothetical protein F5Y03DRAFT_400885 [Xylaria venustula]